MLRRRCPQSRRWRRCGGGRGSASSRSRPTAPPTARSAAGQGRRVGEGGSGQRQGNSGIVVQGSNIRASQRMATRQGLQTEHSYTTALLWAHLPRLCQRQRVHAPRRHLAHADAAQAAHGRQNVPLVPRQALPILIAACRWSSGASEPQISCWAGVGRRLPAVLWIRSSVSCQQKAAAAHPRPSTARCHPEPAHASPRWLPA